jgi:hypothetical protein
MSWDLFVGSQTGPIGTPSDIRKKIDAVLPGVDWEDPSCGYLKQRGYTLEFQLLNDDIDEAEEGGESEAPIDGFTVSVRGGGSPLPALVKLCKAYGWSLGDTGSGEEIDLDNPSDESWKGFQEFRDEVAGSIESRSKKGFWSRLFGRNG